MLNYNFKKLLQLFLVTTSSIAELYTSIDTIHQLMLK